MLAAADPERRQLTEENLGPAVGALDGRVARQVELPVHLRGGLGGLDPGPVVGLVPDAVAVDLSLEVRCRRLRERLERPGLRAPTADLVVRGRPSGRGTGQRELQLQAA